MAASEDMLFSIEGNKLKGFLNARNNCPSRLVIPEGVEEIERNAFYYCREIEEIILPNSLKKIGRGAFWNCDKLTSIRIPDGVTEIESFTFASCDSLKTLTLSKNTRLIGDAAFKWTESLNIIIPPENEFFSYRDGLLFNKDQSKLLMYVNREKDEIVVPDGVESIEATAFEASPIRKSVAKVSLPSSLKCIQVGAFRGCNSLTEIVVPESVTQIGEAAFESCRGLSRVTLPNGINEISKRMFRDCINLKEIHLPKQIRAIREEAFKGCTSLTTVGFRSNEIEIGAEAFKYFLPITMWFPTNWSQKDLEKNLQTGYSPLRSLWGFPNFLFMIIGCLTLIVSSAFHFQLKDKSIRSCSLMI